MTRALCTALLAMAVVGAPAADTQTRPRGEHGGLFPPQDLGLLEAPDRDRWQRPDQIMDALGIADASVVADVGAGAGWFTVRLARRVGPNGLVYAQDVQPQMLAAISRRVQREGLGNVQAVLGDDDHPRLPAGAIDAVLMVGVVREVPDLAALFANLAGALKPQGRIGVVDFRLEGGGPGPEPEARVSPEVVQAAAEDAGLRLLRSESFLPFQYFLIFTTRAPGDTNDQTVGSSAAATSTLTMSASTKG
jgi:SAM-dependent methyltransferase